MIVSIEGHDRIGKSTVIRSLVCRLTDAMVLPRVSDICELMPSQRNELGIWLRGAPLAEIVHAQLVGYKQRDEICTNPVITYLADRGRFTQQAGLIATIMERTGRGMSYATDYFAEVNRGVGYEGQCDVRVLLEAPMPVDEVLVMIEKRNGESLTPSYRKYMRLFVSTLRLLAIGRTDLHRVNALRSPEDVTRAVIDTITRGSTPSRVPRAEIPDSTDFTE